jgi:acetyl esterase/lipase
MDLYMQTRFKYGTGFFAALIGIFCFNPAQAASSAQVETIILWPGPAPGAPAILPDEQIVERAASGSPSDRAVTHVRVPKLELYRPAHPNGSALLIIPGGGYRRVVIDKEGIETAKLAAKAGITAFVLTYRLPEDGWANRLDVSLMDAQQAMRLLRSRAQQYAIDPKRIGVMGFSAGGHVAGKLATRFAQPVDGDDSISVRPDFVCLMYPVVTMKLPHSHGGSREALIGVNPDDASIDAQSIETSIPDHMPPNFIVHAMDDHVVPVENSIQLAAALRAKAIPLEVHLFEEGGHGFGLRLAQGKPVAIWPQLFLSWAERHGMFAGR